MKLKELIKPLSDYKLFGGPSDPEIKGLACNSNQVEQDFIFIAIKGTQLNGHNFIDDAIQRGAKALIIQAPGSRPEVPEGTAVIEVPDSRIALAKLAAEFYGHPSSEIKVAGVTGTNGKTTVTYLLEAIIKKAGSEPAVIGTLNYRFRDTILPSVNTTPGPIEIHSLLSKMSGEKVDYAIIEVSSHALDQGRVEGVNFHSVIFTNLSQDHLDYHKDLKNYFQAKAKLFQKAPPSSFAVINGDDDYGRRIKNLAASERIITYGLAQDCDIRPLDMKFDLDHTEFMLKINKEKVSFKTSLIGEHNIYNALAAIAWADKEGIDLSTVKDALDKFSGVPGRLQRVASKAEFTVFIDYAHTEDALRNVLIALRKIGKGKIITVFGCGGDRDRTKRPKMGEAATELSDYAIITDDNPRCEASEDIIQDIEKGIKKNNYLVMPERKDAIIKSLSLAKGGDIVLIAGKGHEGYQARKGRKVHFDDRETAEECLRSMNY